MKDFYITRMKKLSLGIIAAFLLVTYITSSLAMDKSPVSEGLRVVHEGVEQQSFEEFINSLEELNFLDDEQLKKIGKQVLKGTVKLDLTSLQHTNLSAVYGCLSRLDWVKKINITGGDIEKIIKSVSNFPNLTDLTISYSAQSAILPPEIGDLLELQKLDLSGNQLTTLPSEIGELTKLVSLNLSGNQLTTLPPEIGDLIKLETLENSNNQLTTLPSEIGKLTKLVSLNLSGNQLTTLPPEIGDLIKLETLESSNNQLTTLPSEIGKLAKLVSLNLSGNQLTTLPPEIGRLVELQELDLSGNRLTVLLSKIEGLTKLVSLNLSGNQLTTLPSEIGRLVELDVFQIANNRLTILPSEIWKLAKLTEVNLSGNQLTTLPSEIGELTKLVSLNLSGNQLTTLPSEIGELTKLVSLNLSGNQLTVLPPEIGKLVELDVFQIANNQLTTLPPEIEELVNMYYLDLDENQLMVVPATVSRFQNIYHIQIAGNPMLPEGDSPEVWGVRELRDRFGGRVTVFYDEELDSDGNPIQQMDANTTEEQVYQALDMKPVQVNREWLRKTQLPALDVSNLSGVEIVNLFENVISEQNLEKEGGEGYVSYEILMSDFAKDHDTQNLTNKKKIETYFVPRIKGFLKALYDLPLEEGEVSGWQMYQAQKPAMRQALSFILTKINNETKADYRAVILIQLANAILHCPTGQSEGINTLYYSLQENSAEYVDDLVQIITQKIAIKKNNSFQEAILIKAAMSEQNVHWISYYRDKLKDKLGLTAALGEYTERIGTFGTDPFANNENNVLQMYYQILNPARLTSWVIEMIKTKDDLEIEGYLRELEKLNDTIVTSNASRDTTIEKKIEKLQQTINHLKAGTIPEEYRNQITADNPEEFQQQVNPLIKWLESQQNNLKKMLKPKGTDSNALPSEGLLTYLKKQGIVELEKTGSLTTLEIKDAMVAVKATIKENSQFRPIPTAKILNYLMDNDLINLREKNGWKGYFTASPTEDPLALPTAKAIEKILMHIGALKAMPTKQVGNDFMEE